MDPTVKIAVDVINGEAIRNLREEIEKQEQAILANAAAMRAQGATQQQIIASAQPMAAAIRQANDEIRNLEQASGMSAHGLLNLSYAVDDLQYGFSAIVNNIPQIASAFGAGAGLAGGIAIAGVAINQLIKHWDELSAKLQSAWTGESAEQILLLKERAENAAKAFAELTKAKTEYEGKAIGNATKGLSGDLASDAAVQALVGQMKRAGEGKPIEDQLREDYRTGLIPGVSPEDLDGFISEVVALKLKKKAEELLGGTTLPGEAGRNAISDLQARAKADPQLKQQIGQFIDEADPAEIARRQTNAAQIEKIFKKRRLEGQDVEAGEKLDDEIQKERDEEVKRGAKIANDQRAQAQRELDAQHKLQKDQDDFEVDELNKQGEQQEKMFRRAEARQIKKDSQIIQDSNTALQRRAQRVRDKPKPRIFDSAKSFLSAVQKSSLEGPETRELKRIARLLEKNHDDLTALARSRTEPD